MEHELYKTGDADAPNAILDTHGGVALRLCRACGQGESELAGKCTGAPSAEPPKEKAKRQRAERKAHPKVTMGMVAAVLGVSPSMKRAQVIRQLVREYHGAESEFKSNVAIEYNEQMRETALAAFENQLKRNVIRVDVPKPLVPHLSSHPLTVRSDKYDGPGLVFIRTPYGQRSVTDKKEFKSLDDQPHMFAQMQVEMHLAGTTWGVFFQWSVMAQTARIVERDDAFVERALGQLSAFYDEYKTETKNKDHLSPLLPSVDNQKIRAALDEYDELCVAEDNLKARKAELMAEFIKQAKNNSAMLCGRALRKVERQGSVSYSNIVKEKLPELDLEPYRGKPSEAWTLDA